jgi:hypothetical protein
MFEAPSLENAKKPEKMRIALTVLAQILRLMTSKIPETAETNAEYVFSSSTRQCLQYSSCDQCGIWRLTLEICPETQVDRRIINSVHQQIKEIHQFYLDGIYPVVLHQ